MRFTKQKLRTGDLIELRCGDLFVFVNEQFGFVSVCKECKISENCEDDDNTATYKFITDDFSHFHGIKEFEVMKVYRKYSNNGSELAFPEALHYYDIIWDREDVSEDNV